MFHESVTISGNTNHVLVKDMTPIRSNLRRDQRKTQISITQQLANRAPLSRAFFRPLIQTRKLHTQHRGLQFIQTTVDSDFRVLVFG